MKVGNRVVHLIEGDVGHIERLEDWEELGIVADVRWLTPDNEPSCCSSTCLAEHLKVVSDKVIPRPRSEEWKAESKEFCEGINRILAEFLGETK